MFLYRSDNQDNFKFFNPRRDVGKYELRQFVHSPAYLMTYLPGIFASPTKDYAKAYPQKYIYKLKFDGKLFKLPRDFKKIPSEIETVEAFLGWLKRNNYDGVLGTRAANTSAGSFDEVVVFDSKKLKIMSKLAKTQESKMNIKEINKNLNSLGRILQEDSMQDLKTRIKSYQQGDVFKGVETAAAVKDIVKQLEVIKKSLDKLQSSFDKGSEFLMPAVATDVKNVLRQYLDSFKPNLSKTRKFTPDEIEKIKKFKQG